MLAQRQSKSDHGDGVHSVPHAEVVAKLPLTRLQKEHAASSTQRGSSSKRDFQTAAASSNYPEPMQTRMQGPTE